MVSAFALSAEQLLGIRDGRHRFELLEGRLQVMEPAGGEHGVLAMNVARVLSPWIAEHDLGICLAAETGFIMRRKPDTVRAPDFAFIRAERVPEPLPRGYFEIAPDFVVEVVSPNDSAAAVAAKVAEWLAFGVAEAWALDPAAGLLTVYRSGEERDALTAADVVHPSGCLAGLSVPVRELLSV